MTGRVGQARTRHGRLVDTGVHRRVDSVLSTWRRRRPDDGEHGAGPGVAFLTRSPTERALAVLGSVEGALGMDSVPMALQPLSEVVLGANESLVAYRRRYRSDVDLDAVLDLLLRDDSNPRGLAFQLDRLRQHVAALAWPQGVDLVQRASTAAIIEIDGRVAGDRRVALDSYVLAVRAPLLELSEAIGQHWFADPVNPTLMGEA